MKKKKYIYIKIKKNESGKRIDKTIKKIIKNISRNRIKKLIIKKYVYLNKKNIIKPSKKIKYKDKIKIYNLKKNKNKPIANKKIKINKIYEDKYLLIINKNKNVVMHPGAGNLQNTLMNTLMYYYPDVYKKVPRCGIIHRLDKDTTGLIIIAKNIKSYNFLIKKIKEKKITRIYKTLVYGKIKSNGIINKPISRNKYKRTTMSININGKKAITKYKIIKIFSFCTLLKVKLYTGRTHQIRVHMNYIKHPIVGEKIYTNKNIYKNLKISLNIKKEIKKLNRQALHAYKLKFLHPIKKNKIILLSKLPIDLIKLINKIKKN